MSNLLKAGLVVLGLVVVAFLVLGGGRRMVMGAERKEPIPAPAMDEPHAAAGHETAVFAGGCFWGVQTVFQRVKGVTATTAGYSGGLRRRLRMIRFHRRALGMRSR